MIRRGVPPSTRHARATAASLRSSARTRDLAAAQDALAEAFASALTQWPSLGVPSNPEAWLLTVARRRQIDALRRERSAEVGAVQLMILAGEVAEEPDEIPDRRLALMFACADPDIECGARAPLMLQTVLGLTGKEIASAFLVPPETMSKRLVRAKARIQSAGLAFRIPDGEELTTRLDAVLEAVYAAYTKGWVEDGENFRASLTDEAIWLARVVASLLPDQPEARGLLALLLFIHARRDARRDERGAYVSLDEQDTALWDKAQIEAAEQMLFAASASGPRDAAASRSGEWRRHSRPLRSSLRVEPVAGRRAQSRNGQRDSGRTCGCLCSLGGTGTGSPHAGLPAVLGRPRSSVRRT